MGGVPVMIVIPKRYLPGLMLCIFIVLGLTSMLFWGMDSAPHHTAVFSIRDDVPVTVVIDPGHGGEDGGAVSPDGVEESHLNLKISLRLHDILRFVGQRTVLTRETDISICDAGLNTVRARKASDIRNRVSLVNNLENAVLLSVHQNSLPSSTVTHGAQVFWNRQKGSEILARLMQDSMNLVINPGNEKLPRQIPDTIYLMKHTTAPAALVECGFLSNAEETLCLQESSYQIKLATAISTGYLRCLVGEELTL